ncbi:MAG: AAA family ATPase [Actinomycetota bacterium]|nr:AAA family ATPase [Actinomycetota bacterium]
MAAQACGACGSPNRAGRKFCSGCGTALGAACPQCGTANEPGERFCGECGAQLDAEQATSRAGSVVVERRLVSILFADLAGFTPLAEARDAEDVRELLSRYFDIAAGVVDRYGGQVEKFIGDAVMAVWGTPVTREDDAERAVRAALELVDAVKQFGIDSGMPELALRAAVLTGETAVNLGATGQGMVAGDLVNAASRAQAAAEPNTVLVGEATRRATEAAIAYSDADMHEVKGKAEPIALARALRVTAGRRGGARAEALEPPFVGRERELRLLKELFHANAEERRSNLASVVGVAGIGKSRLAWELYKYLDGIAQEVLWHTGRCLAYGDGVTYWALAEMVRTRAGIAEGEEQEAARAKLAAALESAVGDAEERDWLRPRLGQLLSLDVHEGLERDDLFAGWRLFFERIAERAPIVLVFEDVQWADAPLLEFVEHLLDRSRSHPIFVLALARPELSERPASWAAELRNVTHMALEPLTDDAMQALLDGFAPGLPEALSQQVRERAEGVPLYAVETVRMLIDRGLLERAGDSYRPTGTIGALEVPETLHALVASRLDGLPADERLLIQDASVLGKTFARLALGAVSSAPADELAPLLTALVRKEILTLQADPRSPERGQYAFVQDLLRQVAYDMLSRRERKSRHLDAAAYLDQEWLDADQDEVVEIVASHYLAALELDPAADDAGHLRELAEMALLRAGERAQALGAPDKALRYFEQALAFADGALRRANLHERAGEVARIAGHGPAARTHFERSIAEFETLDLVHPAARVAARLGLLTWQVEGDIERAVTDMERAFSVLTEHEHDADLATLAAHLARALYFRGRVEDAMEYNELALEIGEALDLPEVLSHGFDTKGLILYFSRKRRQEARLLLRHSLDLALANDHSDAALRAYNNLAAVAHNDDRYREALELCVRFEEFARRVGHRRSVLGALGWQAGVLYELGEWDEMLRLVSAVQDEEGPEAIKRWIYADTLPILVHRGRLQDARELLVVQQELTDPNQVQEVVKELSRQALVHLGEGNAAAALSTAKAALEEEAETRSSLYGEALEVALNAAFALGADVEADGLLAIAEQGPFGERMPYMRALSARFGGRRAAVQGDAAEAARRFSAAAQIMREIERPFDLAVVLLEHAEWLAGEPERDDVDELVAEAARIFERLGATPYLERLERLPRPTAVEA